MLGGRFEVFLPPAGQKSVNTSHVILCATLLKKFLGLSAGVEHYKTEKQYLNYNFFLKIFMIPLICVVKCLEMNILSSLNEYVEMMLTF